MCECITISTGMYVYWYNTSGVCRGHYTNTNQLVTTLINTWSDVHMYVTIWHGVPHFFSSIFLLSSAELCRFQFEDLNYVYFLTANSPAAASFAQSLGRWELNCRIGYMLEFNERSWAVCWRHIIRHFLLRQNQA